MDERWGLRPDQMLDYKALKGDATDNIPGVPGVGEKTAAKLVATFGTLDALYERLDEVVARAASPAPRSRHTIACSRAASSSGSSGTCPSSWTSTRHGSASTTATRSWGSSASTSSGA